MTFAGVCDAWLSELQANVTGLDTTTIPADQRHLYTPWAVELGLSTVGERHLAIWPEGEPEVVNPATIGSLSNDLAEQSYLIMVWENASTDSSRLNDDEAAAQTWLTLFEAIRARLYVSANRQLGSVDATAYAGGAFDFRAGQRIMQLRFKTRVFYSFT